MKKIAILAAAAVLGISSAASAQSVGEKTGVSSTFGISPTTTDFVKEAALNDMTEIAASKLGEERGNAEEKAFSAQMITDHTTTSTELKALVSSGDVKAEIPAALDSSAQGKLDKLKAAKPDDFSPDFDSIQVSAHKNAVSLFERYAKGGENPKLKDWAGKTLPTCSTIWRWRRMSARRSNNGRVQRMKVRPNRRDSAARSRISLSDGLNLSGHEACHI